jgi:hypothetical protein
MICVQNMTDGKVDVLNSTFERWFEKSFLILSNIILSFSNKNHEYVMDLKAAFLKYQSTVFTKQNSYSKVNSCSASLTIFRTSPSLVHSRRMTHPLHIRLSHLFGIYPYILQGVPSHQVYRKESAVHIHITPPTRLTILCLTTFITLREELKS